MLSICSITCVYHLTWSIIDVNVLGNCVMCVIITIIMFLVCHQNWTLRHPHGVHLPRIMKCIFQTLAIVFRCDWPDNWSLNKTFFTSFLHFSLYKCLSSLRHIWKTIIIGYYILFVLIFFTRQLFFSDCTVYIWNEGHSRTSHARHWHQFTR